MNKLKQWRRDTVRLFERNEDIATGALLFVGAVLILIALFGKPHHKAMACIYIVL